MYPGRVPHTGFACGSLAFFSSTHQFRQRTHPRRPEEDSMSKRCAGMQGCVSEQRLFKRRRRVTYSPPSGYRLACVSILRTARTMI